LNALWGTTDQDIYAAGKGGVILHYTGTSWTGDSKTAYTLYSLWGSASDNVYAAGNNGIILHYIGGPWSPLGNAVNVLYALWGSSASNIFAVGSSGLIYHYDGIEWTAINPPVTAAIDLYSIWGSSINNVYAGGLNGNLFHYNGTTWVSLADTFPLIFPFVNGINALWGSSASDVFAACDNGVILHYDGTAWEAQDTGTGLNLSSIWGSSGDDVFAAGENGIILKYDSEAGTWSPLDTTGITIEDHLRAIWGSTAGNVYFAGDGGTIVRLQRDDTIPPKVISTGLLTLNDGKAYVTTQVVFHFSEEMDETSLNPETIILTRGSTAIPGTVAVSDDHRSATFTPSDSLAYSTIYAATVRGGAGAAAKDAATPDKNAMEANYTLSFTTEDSPSSGGSGGGGCFIMSARP
ncbi:MAG TPA: Ig-like domain-containing protein, partial [Deltaproteobacteria bacterium]|nr:Ig-like domain-containing protein [Deltaproteobacteria bacterium]